MNMHVLTIISENFSCMTNEESNRRSEIEQKSVYEENRKGKEAQTDFSCLTNVCGRHGHVYVSCFRVHLFLKMHFHPFIPLPMTFPYKICLKIHRNAYPRFVVFPVVKIFCFYITRISLILLKSYRLSSFCHTYERIHNYYLKTCWLCCILKMFAREED